MEIGETGGWQYNEKTLKLNDLFAIQKT